MLAGFVASAFLFCLAVGPAGAGSVPSVIHYQGRLTDNSPQQNPLQGPVSLVFSLHDAPAGGPALWTESWPAVNANAGLVSVLLGSAGSPIPSSIFGSAPLYLEITVNGETLAPRQQLGSVPYAHASADSERLGGQPAAAYAGASHAHAFSEISGLVVDGQIASVSAAKIEGPVDAATLGGSPAAAFAPASGSPNYVRAGTTPQAADFAVTGSGFVGGALAVDGAITAGSVAAANVGALFIRWGRNDCPAGTTRVYDGVAAGASSTQSGGGANLLCLSRTPTWDGLNDANNGANALYGVEYETENYASIIPLYAVQKQEAPCALCLVPTSTLVFLHPGSQACPSGFSTMYAGYLMSQSVSQTRSETVCVDRAPQGLGPFTVHGGAKLHPTEAQCGSLPCPPYVQGREITCSVCAR